MQEVFNPKGAVEYRLDYDEIAVARELLGYLVKANLGHVSSVAKTLQGYMKRNRDWMPKQAMDIVDYCLSIQPDFDLLKLPPVRKPATKEEASAALSAIKAKFRS